MCIAVASIVAFAFGARGAAALDGNAGPIAVSVTPVSRGRAVAIHARVTAGTTIYEIKAHLCVGGARVRDTFEFGFQGTACPNVAVGAGDVERVAAFAAGATTGDLMFNVGDGAAHWVNELGYDQTIECGAGHPCEVVAEIQITNGTVFFIAPVCYGGNCAAAPGTGGQLVQPVVVAANSLHTTTVTQHAAAPGRPPAPKTAARSSSAWSASALGTGRAAASAAHASRASAPERASAATTQARSALQIWLAAAAGAIAGAWILAIVMRGDALLLSGFRRHRRRRANVATVR